MTDNVDYLPVWKKDATAEEWFQELAMMARKDPSRFQRVVVTAQQELTSSQWRISIYRRGVDKTHEVMGILESAKHWFWSQT